MKKSRSPPVEGLRPLLVLGNVSVFAILLDPVALLVLLVLVLYRAPGDTVGAVLLAVLILCGVESLLVDLLGVLGQVVLDVVRKLSNLLVRHFASSFGSLGRGARLAEQLPVSRT